MDTSTLRRIKGAHEYQSGFQQTVADSVLAAGRKVKLRHA
jgi:hypothetical protein